MSPDRSKSKDVGAPRERDTTVRAQLREELLSGPVTARELSARAGIREREVAGHLEHLSRSAEARGERLVVEPASCLACGYRFEQRRRLTTPGRCPRCGSERVEPPSFRLESRQERR